MAYNAIHIAKKLVDKARADGLTDMTLLKLIKMTYIAHGWMLEMYDKPLISEDIQAWKYGPVIPELYAAIKDNGNNLIEDITAPDLNLDQDAQYVVDQIYNIYKKYTAGQLVALTHADGTPWASVTDSGKGNLGPGVIITNDDIKSYYRGFRQKSETQRKNR